jgi:hypothetical protein
MYTKTAIVKDGNSYLYESDFVVYRHLLPQTLFHT